LQKATYYLILVIRRRDKTVLRGTPDNWKKEADEVS